MNNNLRVALFTDSYPETNGVATFCRELAYYARDTGRPFLAVYGGAKTQIRRDGSLTEFELRRGPAKFPVDGDLKCDPLIYRFRNEVLREVMDFQPDLVHFTGPGDISILGLWMSNLAGVPATASWHTNVHEYACRRLQSSLPFLPAKLRNAVALKAGCGTLWAATKFYRIAHFLSAPNTAMRETLAAQTGRPCYQLGHGVDPSRFRPEQRHRSDNDFVIGYVGRLTPEKNVRYFAELERRLEGAGAPKFRIVMVGEGYERPWLEKNLRHAQLTGILRGPALAEAFAGMDAFVFPSLTDTFGLVILEAMASGVPVVLPIETGRRAAVVNGETGIVTADLAEGVLSLMKCRATHERLSAAARAHACSVAWPIVFEDLYRLYAEGMASENARSRWPTPKFTRS